MTKDSRKMPLDGDDISILAFSGPWMKGAWPSLGIASLKSFLQTDGIDIRCCHFHLEAAARLGWAYYDAIAETWGAGEALFGALLDPEDSERLIAVAVELLRDAKQDETADWVADKGVDDLKAVVDAWLERERPERFSVVGGSIGAVQLCGSLYLMKRIRQRGHKGVRVLGGSGLVGSVSREVLTRCPDVDYIVEGEGEHAFLGLIKSINDPARRVVELSGVLSRDSTGAVVSGPPALLMDLDEAPPANLDEFFETAIELGVPTTGLILSFEHSRGCAWEHRTKGKLRGCTFCGLYRTSPNYRQKPVNKVLDDVAQAVQHYKILNLAFVDPYLSVGFRHEFLDGLISLPPDVSLFTEMRCDLTPATVERLAARAHRVQLGVESFTTAILRRINKGVSAVETVYSVRLCQEYGIPTQYNLMCRVPGVSRHEIDELRDVMPVLYGLIPPSLANFYLDRNSLIYADPEAYGVSRGDLDTERPVWLPHILGDSRVNQVVPLNITDTALESAWALVDDRVEEWNECWRLAKSAGIQTPLVWRDGEGWAQIIDAREGVARIYVIEDILYEVFRACKDIMSQSRLTALLPQFDPAFIDQALQELAAHRLIFQDGHRYVSVAVRERLGVA